MNRDKVINGIDICLQRFHCGEDCPYYNDAKSGCMEQLREDALSLLKEQETVQWINVKDKLPEKDGQYLVVYTFFDFRGMGVVRFSHNLHEIDEYIFDTESRPGWYESDDEVGYFERTTVTHWAKLPEFPKEGGEVNG